MIYFVMFFLILYNLIIDFYKVPYKKTINIITLILLILFAGFRYETGYDYYSYIKIYDKVNNFSFKEYKIIHGEYIFLMILTFLKKLQISPQSIFFIFPLITLSILYKSIKRYKIYFGVTFFLYYSNYYFNSNFSQIRQGLVYVIVLFLINYIINKNIKKFLLFLLLGSLIQKTIFLFFPMYFLGEIKINRKKIIILIILSFVCFRYDIISMIILYLPIPNYFMKHINSYLYNSNYLRNVVPIFGIIYRILSLLIFYEFGKKIKHQKIYKIAYNQYFIGVLLYITLGQITIISTRAMNMYGIVEVILYSLILKNNRGLKRIIIIGCMIFLGTYMFTKTIYIDGKEAFIPYKTVFQN